MSKLEMDNDDFNDSSLPPRWYLVYLFVVSACGVAYIGDLLLSLIRFLCHCSNN